MKTKIKSGDVVEWSPIRWKHGHPIPEWKSKCYALVLKVCPHIIKVRTIVPEALRGKYGLWWPEIRHASPTYIKPTNLRVMNDLTAPAGERLAGKVQG